MSRLIKGILGILMMLTFSMTIGASAVQAVTVALKSGKIVRGRIVGRNFREITVATQKGRVTVPFGEINTIQKGVGTSDRDVYTLRKELTEYKRQQRLYQKDPAAAKQRQRQSIEKNIKTNRRKRELEWKKNTTPPKRLQKKRKSGERNPTGRKKYGG